MNVVYQNKIVPSTEVQFGIENRGFLYGDGFFETLFAINNLVPYLDLHYKRILNAASTLEIQLPTEFTQEALDQNIKTLCQSNNLEKARIKIMIWRKEGGYYTPTSTNCETLIMCSPMVNISSELSKVGIDTVNLLAPSPFSKFKTLSSLKYVASGIFQKRQNFQDVILLDQKQNIAEMLYSNIFWFKDDQFYTPCIRTGCVEGIMRNLVLNYFEQNNINYSIGSYSIDDLLSAESCFSCNSLSIRSILSIDSASFKKNELVEVLYKKLLGKYL